MPRSLEEIQAEFKSKTNVSTELPITEASKNAEEEPTKKEKGRSKSKRIALISDIIFVVALLMMGICAVILSYGESGAQVGGIYQIVNDRREMAIVIFAGLIVFSFILRFFAQGKKEA